MTPSYRDRNGALEASFEDGVAVQLHRTKSGRIYTLKPYRPLDPSTPVPPERRNDYQRAALDGFLNGAKMKISADRDGDLFAER